MSPCGGRAGRGASFVVDGPRRLFGSVNVFRAARLLAFGSGAAIAGPLFGAPITPKSRGTFEEFRLWYGEKYRIANLLPFECLISYASIGCGDTSDRSDPTRS